MKHFLEKEVWDPHQPLVYCVKALGTKLANLWVDLFLKLHMGMTVRRRCGHKQSLIRLDSTFSCTVVCVQLQGFTLYSVVYS